MLDQTFASLADPTRRAILERLTRERKVPVGELATPFAMSLPAIIKHINILESAGLVARERRGRTVLCTLKADPMTEAQQWLDRNLTFWASRLDSLEQLLSKEGTYK